MNKYATEPVGCRESKKELKQRIKVEKLKLNDFINLVENMDINYESKQTAVGSLYLNIVGMEKRLKDYK